MQDIGGRDRRLFDSVVIDTRECADDVVDAVRVVLRDCPGIQALTDQGTSYMAAAAKLAFDELKPSTPRRRRATVFGSRPSPQIGRRVQPRRHTWVERYRKGSRLRSERRE